MFILEFIFLYFITEQGKGWGWELKTQWQNFLESLVCSLNDSTY